jgi:hypothetical protein
MCKNIVRGPGFLIGSEVQPSAFDALTGRDNAARRFRNSLTNFSISAGEAFISWFI